MGSCNDCLHLVMEPQTATWQQQSNTAEQLFDSGSLAAQVLVIGKISQAAVVAASAYKDQEAFQKQTGITKSCLIDDKLHRNTKVLQCSGHACTAVAGIKSVHCQMTFMQQFAYVKSGVTACSNICRHVRGIASAYK